MSIHTAPYLGVYYLHWELSGIHIQYLFLSTMGKL